MRTSLRAATALAIAASLSVIGCQSNRDASPTGLQIPGAANAAANPSSNGNGKTAASPQEAAVLAALGDYKQAVLDSDISALDRIWSDDYTFINPQGAIATKAQRLANFSSGNTNIDVIDSEREVTVRVYGDMAIVQNLSTLHGHFQGVPTDTDLRGTFVFLHRAGIWQLVMNQLTAVVAAT
jgi:ketosteroid isomerase-like protein